VSSKLKGLAGRRADRWAPAGALAIVLLLFGFAVTTLLALPVRGVADIRDFWRVMRPAGIEHVAPLTRPGFYVRRSFVTGPSDLGSLPSSSALLAWVAKQGSGLFGAGPGRMDLRQVGVLYLVLLAAVVAAGLRRGLSPGLAALLLWVLVDPNYLLFFNSFYADATLILALAAAVVWLERSGAAAANARSGGSGHGIVAGSLAVLIALLGGGSKMQNVLFPFVLLAAALPSWPAARSRRWRASLGLAAALTASGLLVAWNFTLGPGPRFPVANNYNAVYGGLLRVASDPQHVLRTLGVPREFDDLPRADLWSAGIGFDHPVHAALANLSRVRLLGLYASDPPAIARVAGQVERVLVRERAHRRGELERSENDRRPVVRTVSVPWQFARVSRGLLSLWPPLVLVLPAVALAWTLVGARRRGWNGRRTAMLFLLLWSATQVVVAVLGEGLVNLDQHLLGARLGLDLMSVVWLVDLVASARSRFARARPDGAAATAPIGGAASL